MKIIIDGYNLLKSRLAQKRGLSQKQLLHLLESYTRRKNHSITIVFDGGMSKWPAKMYENQVTLIYSGTALNADTVIKGLITEECKGKECVIVSSDNDIILYAQQHEIVSIDAVAFYHLMVQQAPVKKHKPTAALKRPGYTSSTELDLLMQQSKPLLIKDEAEEEFLESKKVSKREKKLQEILKKL
ncbi:MAG: NYN domain-containing protein [Candidatus Babeliaceae bacterium]